MSPGDLADYLQGWALTNIPFREWRGLRNTKPERGKFKMTKEDNGATNEAEKLVGKELTQVKAQLKAAEDEIEMKRKEIVDLKLANAKLKDRAETEVKGKLIDDIRKVSNYGIEYLAECSIDRLELLLEDSKMIRKPMFSSSGDFGRGPDPQDKLRTMYKYTRKRD